MKPSIQGCHWHVQHCFAEHGWGLLKWMTSAWGGRLGLPGAPYKSVCFEMGPLVVVSKTSGVSHRCVWLDKVMHVMSGSTPRTAGTQPVSVSILSRQCRCRRGVELGGLRRSDSTLLGEVIGNWRVPFPFLSALEPRNRMKQIVVIMLKISLMLVQC